MDVADLNRTFQRHDAVTFEMSPLGGPVARLRIAGSETTIALQGAQVLGWRHKGTEMLWLSPMARLGTAKAVRGGVPVCWPWFGPHPADPAKPAHGFVRTRDWAVTASSSDRLAASITLATATGPGDAALFPHTAAVSLTVTLGDSLALSLETRNTGATDIPLTQALHTYFRVPDIAATVVESLTGARYIDKLGDDASARHLQVGPITFDREVDRIYLGATQSIVLASAQATGRHLVIESEGSASAIVWNPWIDKTIRLGDMGGPNAYRHMVCIETANAGDDVVNLPAGERHCLRATYRLVSMLYE